MLKQTLFRFAVLWALCGAATVFLLRPQAASSALLGSLTMAFFFYAFSWAQKPLAWLFAFGGRYGFLALMFRSIPGIILIAVLIGMGLPVICMVAIALGILRLLYNIGYSIYLDFYGGGPGDDGGLAL